MLDLLYFRQCISWPNFLSSSYSQNSFPPCTYKAASLSPCIIFHPSFASNWPKQGYYMLSWMNWCCLPYNLTKKPLSNGTLTHEFKNKNNLFIYRYGSWKNPWCLCNIPSGFLGITLVDSTFCDSPSQWPTSCKHLSTAMQKQASTGDAVCPVEPQSGSSAESVGEKCKGHCLPTTPMG